MKPCHLLLLALLIPTTALSADRWVRLSPDNNDVRPKNLARCHMGAFQVDPRVDPQPLMLRDDPVLGTSIARGTSERVVQLGQVDTINRFTMLNDGGAGKVSILSAVTQGDVAEGRWTPLGSAVFETDTEVVDIRFGATDAGFVRLVYEMAVGGDVYEMAVFGMQHAGNYRIVCAAPTGAKNPKAPIDPKNPVDGGPMYPGLSMRDFNLTRLYAGGQVAYVSSGRGDPVSMIDNDAATRYVFPTSDRSPTVITQLSQMVQVDRVSAVLATSEPGTLYLYVLGDLPEERNWTGRPSVDANFLDDIEPSAIHRNVNGAGRFEARLNPPVGQYVVLKFVPASVAPAPAPQDSPRAETSFIPLTNPAIAIQNDGERCCIVALGVFSDPIGAFCWVAPLSPDEIVEGEIFGGPLADFSPWITPRVNSVSP